jgi:HEAT repeat protein
MSKKYMRLLSRLLAGALTMTTVLGFAQPGERNLNTAICRLESSSWSVRRDSFYSIVGLDPSLERTSNRVMKLLVKENSFVANGSKLSAEYVDYYADVIGTVASLDDPRSLNALLGCMTTGDMAIDGIARLGPVAVHPVLAKLASSNSDVRQAAASALSAMLDLPASVRFENPVLLNEIKRGLMRAVSDSDPYVRMTAIEGLAKIGGSEVRAILQRLAAEDPYEASVHGGDKGIYPVRTQAQSLLVKNK